MAFQTIFSIGLKVFSESLYLALQKKKNFKEVLIVEKDVDAKHNQATSDRLRILSGVYDAPKIYWFHIT